MNPIRIVLALAVLLVLPAAPARAQERVAQRAALYDEDPQNPAGLAFPGTVIWCLNRIKAADGADDVEILGRADIPERKLKVTMSVRRNADASLPASHVIELKIDLNGGGIAAVPGILMKTAEQAKGVPLMSQAVRVTDGFYMLGLQNGARATNVASMKQREWFDVPMVYKSQRRAILAIEKGLYGRQVFQAAFEAWGEAPSSDHAFEPPRCSDKVSSRADRGETWPPPRAGL